MDGCSILASALVHEVLPEEDVATRAAATAAIVHYGMQVVDSTRQNALLSADAGGSAVAREIVGFIDREHERLRAFAEEKNDEIRRILAFPDDWPAIDAWADEIAAALNHRSRS